MSERKSSTITIAAAATTAAAVACGVMLGSYYVTKKTNAQRATSFRIVSLNPSTTQTIYDLGLADFVVGRTRYCPGHPDSRSKKIPKVGGTKDVDWEMIRALKPTHILFNMEENVYTELPMAQSICNTIFHTPVNIEESRDSVVLLGRIFGANERARIIVNDIDDALHQLQSSRNSKRSSSSSFTYLYFIWHSPEERLAGGSTYIHAMLNAAGGINLAEKLSQERYPLLSTLVDNNSSNLNNNSEPLVADYCLLSTEPFPFKEHHVKDYQQFGRHETKIINGEMCCWHGSRMAQGLRYLDGFFSQ